MNHNEIDCFLDVKKRHQKNKNHPELMPDEVWVTNSDENGDDVSFKTKRVGKIAYDQNGSDISDCGLVPVFAMKEEVFAKK